MDAQARAFALSSQARSNQNANLISTFFGQPSNLINPNTINSEVNLNYNNGTLLSNANWATSDFIPIDQSTNYHVNKMANGNQYWISVAFYNKYKVFISFVNEGYTSNVTSPSDAYYMRIAVFNKTNNVYNLLLINLCKSTIALPVDGTNFAYGTRYVDNNSTLSQMDQVLNLLNPDTITPLYKLNTSNGQLYSHTNYATSDYIPVEPSTTYQILQTSSSGNAIPYYGMYCFYDKNKNFISSSVEGSWYTLTTPSNVAYVRYAVAGYQSGNSTTIWNIIKTNFCKNSIKLPYFAPDVIYPYNQRFLKSTYIDWQNERGWKFKYITTFGDSLVAQGKWQNQVINYFGMYHTNCGQGGSQVAGTEFIGSDGLLKQPMWEDVRINAIPTYSDIILIHGGTNDHGPISTGTELVGDLTSTDTNTFYGAYMTMLNKMMTRFPNARIVLLLPFWNSGENTDSVLENIRGYIRDIGNHYGFPVFESRKIFGFNSSNCNTFFQNESGTYTHVNTVGGNRVADCIIGYMKTIAPYNNQTIALSAYTTTLSAGGTTTITTNGIAVTWASSNTAIATVDVNGNITAVATGSTTITATDTLGNTATVSVTVS